MIFSVHEEQKMGYGRGVDPNPSHQQEPTGIRHLS